MLGPRHGPRHHSLHRSMHLLGPADAGTNINKHPIGLFSCRPLSGYILVGAPTCKLVTRVLPAQLRGPAVGPDRWDAEEQTNKQSKPTFHLKGSEAWGLSRPPIQKNRDCPCAHPHVVRCHRDCGTAVPPAQ